MNEMVERVARALIAAGDNQVHTGFLSEEQAEVFARSAITAIREPTQDMKDAHPFTFDGGYEAAEVWQAMLDAALRSR
jgi:hypothetical protein